MISHLAKLLTTSAVPSSSDVVVVGGGLVGLATAHALASSNSDLSITVVEAEAGVARHQSGRNSGVLHSGVYYQPGSQKAALCVDGAQRMSEFCAEHDVAIEHTGKVIVATSPSEIATLNDLERSRDVPTGLPDLEMVDEAGLREHEPHATGIQALFVPQAGVVDFGGVADRLVSSLLESSGHEVRTGFDVVAIDSGGPEYRLTARTGDQQMRGISSTVPACTRIASPGWPARIRSYASCRSGVSTTCFQPNGHRSFAISCIRSPTRGSRSSACISLAASTEPWRLGPMPSWRSDGTTIAARAA